MRIRPSLVTLGLLAAAAALVGTPTADAGNGVDEITITYNFSGGDDPVAVAAAATPELFELGGQDVTGSCSAPVVSTTSVTITCVPGSSGTFVIGASNIDGYYPATGSCNVGGGIEMFDETFATFTIQDGEDITCALTIVRNPTLYLDKVITDDAGPLTASDFTLEVYENGTLVAAAVDPSPGLCGFPATADPSTCALVDLPPGNYTIGEEPEYGYTGVSITCVQNIEPPLEAFPGATGDFVHGAGNDPTACVVTNEYTEVPVTADIVVVNDDGGTAVGADFTIEVFDNNGVLVDSGVDPQPGTANMSVEFVLPVGDYSFGVSGPSGYTASATVGVISLPEIIADPSADFTVSPSQTAAGVIQVNDPPPPPTTTTTTTTTTSTTSTTTTTLAPATTPPPPTTVVMDLPETGPSNSTGSIALIASLALAAGLATTAAARRRPTC